MALDSPGSFRKIYRPAPSPGVNDLQDPLGACFAPGASQGWGRARARMVPLRSAGGSAPGLEGVRVNPLVCGMRRWLAGPFLGVTWGRAPPLPEAGRARFEGSGGAGRGASMTCLCSSWRRLDAARARIPGWPGDRSPARDGRRILGPVAGVSPPIRPPGAGLTRPSPRVSALRRARGPRGSPRPS